MASTSSIPEEKMGKESKKENERKYIYRHSGDTKWEERDRGLGETRSFKNIAHLTFTATGATSNTKGA